MSLRDALARKQRRETHFDLLIADPTDPEAAVEQADKALARAVRTYDEDAPEVNAARASLEEARAALAACVHRITFRNLAPHHFEELLSEHPPAKDSGDDAEWNPKTFAPALIAACAVDDDLDEKAWAAELDSDRWSRADRSALFNTALAANVTVRSVSLPKG